MYRDRTNLFLSYRRTFPHQRLSSTKYTVANKDLEDQPFIGNEDGIAMDNFSRRLPPRFFDLTFQVDEALALVDRLLVQLAKLYQKNSLPGFQDNRQDEQQIEDISFQVIKKFQECFGVIKTLTRIKETQFSNGQQLNKDELRILDNLEKNYALKVQEKSQKFRVLQNNHLKFLNKDDFKPLPTAKSNDDTLLLLEEEVQQGDSNEIDSYSKQTLQKQNAKMHDSNQQFLQQRDEEITQLAKGVLEVSTIFREMQSLIIDQGTVVDRIDYNLENTVVELKQAQRELDKATHYQKRSQKCKIILFLSLLVLAMFMLVMLKPHHRTIKETAPSPDQGQPKNGNSGGSGNQADVVNADPLLDPESNIQ
ncbi:t-SNARE affecting a late Golgi compartment protein 2 [Kluyveromyces marxianus]|uniref:t-SNARE affecting a late Golgi compartment protein 2 n=2 Tax=Kluyveromyces marxianus TaxID=4911 RepID=W0T7S1_KLUMD|nr:t-SNARE affecting a late Golgi compartment protein 2 [Kluyveromyces marxianus DMKU3-1042]QGN13672.1 t-SNARE affecting a late Golgi compartment protein 2 [Kluyveromyces marxianus]BAO38149.1 t-SNARE affecting a late Golgi compartment protein 2 [Kluyveromyces marxianus DMKU3-1042]BAP69717.1 t-SNARE affecting a late Golgi compartment protein 2 [Kluyveromyces marxianus]